MQDVGNEWSDEAKATFYLAERLSPENALYYQFGMPLPFVNLGYAYSDNWKRGAILDGIIIDIAASTIFFVSLIEIPISSERSIISIT